MTENPTQNIHREKENNLRISLIQNAIWNNVKHLKWLDSNIPKNLFKNSPTYFFHFSELNEKKNKRTSTTLKKIYIPSHKKINKKES